MRGRRTVEVGPPRVVLASDDREFQRFASAVLGNGGHRTLRSPVTAARIERLARLHAPEVVVLDAREDAVLVAEVCAALLAGGRTIGLVLVREEASDAGDLPVVARWGAPEQLLGAVRRAGAPAPAVDDPTRASAARLRAVPDDPA